VIPQRAIGREKLVSANIRSLTEEAEENAEEEQEGGPGGEEEVG
jgi:hypothetical protein